MLGTFRHVGFPAPARSRWQIRTGWASLFHQRNGYYTAVQRNSHPNPKTKVPGSGTASSKNGIWTQNKEIEQYASPENPGSGVPMGAARLLGAGWTPVGGRRSRTARRAWIQFTICDGRDAAAGSVRISPRTLQFPSFLPVLAAPGQFPRPRQFSPGAGRRRQLGSSEPPRPLRTGRGALFHRADRRMWGAPGFSRRQLREHLARIRCRRYLLRPVLDRPLAGCCRNCNSHGAILRHPGGAPNQKVEIPLHSMKRYRSHFSHEVSL